MTGLDAGDRRGVALAGAAAGLAAAPVAAARPGLAGPSLAAGAGLALAAWRGPGPARTVALALAAALAGLWLGSARLGAIDAGALHGADGERLSARGFVVAVPRRSAGTVRVEIETAHGRLAVEAPQAGAPGELEVGGEVRVRGTLRDPAAWESAYLARSGVAQLLEARAIEPTGRRRGGLAGVSDSVRRRAEAALARGVGERQAALLRGFILGQDDLIDPGTVEDFKRSGLAHLLAVSGENVILLGLLAGAVLGVLGVPLRSRLVCVLALIALYVPVTGAGPSIQRAGVMGAAAVVALLAGRPRARWHALLLAAALTLALNPRASGDPGWQLSFAAVIGIVLWAPPIREALRGAAPAGEGPGGMEAGAPAGARPALARALAEGAAVTIAATLATAPLFAHHFGAVAVASLPANLLALPAIAPMMWLGMLSAAAGQAPWLPLEPLTALAGALAGYVAQVASWLGSPSFALLDVSLPGAPAVVAAYASMALAVTLALRWARRRAGAAPSPRARRALAAVAVAGIAAVALVGLAGPGAGPVGPAPRLRLAVLDVGQGDAILLDPAGGGPVLVDGGPPGAGLESELRALGVTRLAAAIVTHGQSDHAGGIAELFGSLPVRRLVYAGSAGPALGAARAAGVPATRVAEGSAIGSGPLRLSVLWPPRTALTGAAGGADPNATSGADPSLTAGADPSFTAGADPSFTAGADPNATSIVLLARWHSFEALLTGDAEAEAVPLDPGPLDVLKVAHHGSEDAGLAALLDRAAPQLALISAGAGNPYGHPHPTTLETLRAHGVAVARTDLAGNVVVDVGRGGFTIGPN